MAQPEMRRGLPFQADPEWVKTRTEMQVGLQVENVFMSATDYSPLK